MIKYLEIDLLQYQDKIKLVHVDGRSYFFDPIRKKNITLQPEELVRQLLLCYLIEIKNFSKSRIAVERAFTINHQLKRFDLLTFDLQGQPYLLVECKSFDTELSDKVITQAAIYNKHLKAPYLLVSNGKESICCKVNQETGEWSCLEEMIN